MLSTTLRPLYDLLRSAAWSFSIPVHFSTRCLVSVREPSCESIKIVSFATKKVNEWPVVVSLEASIMVGLPPERANLPAEAVYSAWSAEPRRSAWRTVTPPRARAWSSWRPSVGDCWPGFAEAGAVLALALAAFVAEGLAGAVAGVRQPCRVRDCMEPCWESAVTPVSRWALPGSPQYVSIGARICQSVGPDGVPGAVAADFAGDCFAGGCVLGCAGAGGDAWGKFATTLPVACNFFSSRQISI